MKIPRLKLANVPSAETILRIGYWIIAIFLMSFAVIFAIIVILLSVDSTMMSGF